MLVGELMLDRAETVGDPKKNIENRTARRLAGLIQFPDDRHLPYLRMKALTFNQFAF